MPPWLLDALRCPRYGDPLAPTELPPGALDGALVCACCDAPWPVLGGVPVLVPDPGHWLTSHRDAVLASLAEAGRLGPESVAIVDAFQLRGVEAARFGDDWVPDEERTPAPPDALGRGVAPSRDAFARFLQLASRARPDAMLAEMLGDAPGRVLELGAGAGALSRRLAPRAEQLIVADLSLRAVLRATDALPPGRAAPVVLEAETPATSAVDAIVAANIVDLLEAPEAFTAAAASLLPLGGRLALSTPDPALGGEDDGALAALLEESGFAVLERRDGVPWLRAHRAREHQVYFCQLLLAERRDD